MQNFAKLCTTTITSEVFVLTAGLGTRLRPFTNHVPKPLVPVLGVPLLEFCIQMIQAQGIQKIVANTHSHPEQVRKFLSAHKIQESFEPELLGSAGGYRQACEKIQGDRFFAINGDSLCWADFSELENAHIENLKRRPTTMTLWLHPRSPGEGKYRSFQLGANGKIEKLVEDLKSNVPFYTGIGIFEKSAFAHLPLGKPTDFLAEVLRPALERGEVSYFSKEIPWWDVGDPKSWWQLQMDLIQSKNDLPDLWKKLIDWQNVTNQIAQWPGCISYDSIGSQYKGRKGIAAFGESVWFE